MAAVAAAKEGKKKKKKTSERIFLCIPREPFYSQIINYFHLCAAATVLLAMPKMKTFQLSAVAVLSVALFLFLFYLFFFTLILLLLLLLLHIFCVVVSVLYVL